MKKSFYYALNHKIIVYHDLDDEFDNGNDAFISIDSDTSINRVSLWEYVQEHWGSIENNTRKDIKPSLEEVVDGIYEYLKKKKISYFKVEGQVDDSLGDYIYTKEHTSKERLCE